MEILRKLRWVLYPSVFIVVFLLGSYCSFPPQIVREMAENSITNAALSFGPANRGMPKVSIKDVSLWRVSGMSLSGLKIIWPGNKKEMPLNLDIDKLKARLGIFPALIGHKNIAAYADLYGGNLQSELSLKQNSLANVDASVQKLDLGKMAFLASTLGAPLQGILSMAVKLNANSQLSKEGTGSLDLNIERGIFGPGNVTLPQGGMVPSMSVPQVSLGKITAKFSLDKGQLESKTFTFSGGDLEGDMQLSVILGRIPQISRLNGKGWFSLKKEFINANETIKMLFDLLPELRTAAQSDGKVGFSVLGTLARPQFRLQQYVPEKSAQKK